jgi:hypothetical protein
MPLCTACERVDFSTLLTACLQQCRDRQANADNFDTPLLSSRFNHHPDIFEIKISGRHCDLCKVIFKAFEKRKVADPEEARGLPIIIRASSNKIKVCYDAEEGLITLCCLDIYMDEVDGNYSLRRMYEED